MPRLPYCSSTRSSRSEKARPSPVPCSSIKIALLIHHEVHIGLCVGIFQITEVQDRFVVHNPHAHGGNLPDDGIDGKKSVLHQFMHGKRQRHIRARDGRGARAAVGLQHVAVQRDRSWPEQLHIHGLPQRTPDQALDFHTAPVHA